MRARSRSAEAGMGHAISATVQGHTWERKRCPPHKGSAYTAHVQRLSASPQRSHCACILVSALQFRQCIGSKRSAVSAQPGHFQPGAGPPQREQRSLAIVRIRSWVFCMVPVVYRAVAPRFKEAVHPLTPLLSPHCRVLLFWFFRRGAR